MVLVIFRANETNMKRLLMLLVLVFAGCGDPSGVELLPEEIISQVNASGRISDEQVETLSKVEGKLCLDGLTSITDSQAEILSKVGSRNFDANSLLATSQVGVLYLNGLTAITDQQAESLSKVKILSLNGLTCITDQQAESLGKVESLLLGGLTSITEAQTGSPSRRESA